MKVLTNIQTSTLGGIGQTLKNLVDYLENDHKQKVRIVGINVDGEPNSASQGINYDSGNHSCFRLININYEPPYFGDVVKTATSVDDLKAIYSHLISSYISIIKREKPDLILLNGTYFIPWCLFQAGSLLNVPMILHYHGILTKETSHYPSEIRQLIHSMEISFDNDQLYYIFPSQLAKTTVETEVFGHPIARSAVIHNSIPNHFFRINTTGSRKNVAFVGRWSAIKNPSFIKKIIKYNLKNNNYFRINIVTDKDKAQKDLGKIFAQAIYREPMDNQLLAEFYRNMGIIISPSYFETYGNVPQEAVASGTPALIGANMGIAEVFRQLDLTDWIVDFSSTKNVFAKIKSISGQSVDPKVRRMMKYNLNSTTISEKMIQTFRSA